MEVAWECIVIEAVIPGIGACELVTTADLVIAVFSKIEVAGVIGSAGGISGADWGE